jgi:hypothetical protein
MPERRAPVLAAALAVVALAVAGGCGRDAAPADAAPAVAWLPAFAAREAAIDRVTVRTPDGKAAVTLKRDGKRWRVVERDGWPVAPGRVEGLLDALAQAHRVEAKTTHAERYARIGVAAPGHADVAEVAAVALDLAGGGAPLRLLLGHPHGERERFVRVDGDRQAWLVDQPLPAPPAPTDWIDTRLVDAPLVRIARVDVHDAAGHAFTLEHVDDRFRVVGVPAAAMGDSHAGDALAGALDHLEFQDVARDDGKAAPEHVMRFTGHDGSWLELSAWRIDGRVWARATTSDTGDLARAWQASGKAGWRFLLPAMQSATLAQSREQVLAPVIP